jgi:sugar phosphate isomerase/epimerase
VAVEDLPRTCLGRNSDEILELIGAHDALRVCFDTNHLLGENPVDFICKLKGKIITTHVSDYDFINERHWLPGEGDLDWNAIFGALREIGYDGAWLYELGFACPKSILRPRALTCEDIARNARELFDGKNPTVISERIPNIGMWV